MSFGVIYKVNLLHCTANVVHAMQNGPSITPFVVKHSENIGKKFRIGHRTFLSRNQAAPFHLALSPRYDYVQTEKCEKTVRVGGGHMCAYGRGPDLHGAQIYWILHAMLRVASSRTPETNHLFMVVRVINIEERTRSSCFLLVCRDMAIGIT